MKAKMKEEVSIGGENIILDALLQLVSKHPEEVQLDKDRTEGYSCCSLEELGMQEEGPDCSNAFQCCLYRLGQCDGFPKNCPDFDC